MIYKQKEFKFKRIDSYRIIFTVLLIISFMGLCTGCLFALKNADNFDFVKQITLTENYTKIENKGLFRPYSTILIRDIFICAVVLILKYSGIQKSLVVCVPFVLAVQNGAVYTILLSAEEINIFHLLFDYVIKDTAVLLITILYVNTVIKQILNHKDKIKKDIQLMISYITVIMFIYIIYFAIKIFIYSGM